MHDIQGILDDSMILSPAYHAYDVNSRRCHRMTRGRTKIWNQPDLGRVGRVEITISYLLLFILLHTRHTPNMSATIRSLRPLMRTASPAMRRLPLLAGQARTYKQPARDLMTGEVTQLPDIDVTQFLGVTCIKLMNSTRLSKSRSSILPSRNLITPS
jgi:hypothetical protein